MTFIQDQITHNVDGNLVTVDGLIDARFANAYTASENAWNALQPFLQLLEDIKWDLPWVPVTLADVDTDIIAQIIGVRPELGDIDSYVSGILAVDVPDFPSYQIPPNVEFSSGGLGVANAIFVKLLDIVQNGGTGLGAVIEALIWDRMKQRQETENARQWLEAENYFAGRGFDLPPGALSGKLNEISIEIVRNNANTNNDISVEQARLAQTNTHFALSEGSKAVVTILGGEADRLVAYNKSICDIYIARLEAAKAKISKFISIIDGAVKVIAAKVNLYTADVQAASAIADIQYKMASLKVQLAVANAEVAIKELAVAMDSTKGIIAVRIESLKSAAQVLGQICASALTSVNASASMGVSTSVGEQVGVSFQESNYTSKTEETRREIQESISSQE